MPKRSSMLSEESLGTSAKTKVTKQAKLEFLLCDKFDKASKRDKDITHSVSCFIAMDMLPLSAVKKPDFKQLHLTLDLQHPSSSLQVFL